MNGPALNINNEQRTYTDPADRKKHNKTLRQQLQESINNETDDNKKIMKESLNTLGIKLTEDAYTKDELRNKFGTTDLDIINAGNEETVTLKITRGKINKEISIVLGKK